MNAPSYLDFPCEFPVKAVGRAQPHFEALVVEIIRQHAPDLAANAVAPRLSQGGQWIAVTVVIQATSQTQIDAIYQALSAHAAVHLVL